MRKRRRKEEESNVGNWLTTYSDMVTLLLCFFVLLFSFSEIDAQKFRSIMSSFQGGTGVLEGGTTLDLNENLESSEGLLEEDLEELKDILEKYADSIGLGEEIILSVEERGLVVRFMDSVLFDSGKADLKPESKKILKNVADILNRDEFKDKLIKVEGHTDTDPIIYSKKYPTNWELSAIRATNVLRYLVEEGNIKGSRISSSGYSYYRPIAPNDTPENKAKNRRVDIVILQSSFEEIEP
ncbi:chemotaxis protein MotB [Keratinibaculum paraultunense]|uniref:Chemotaxis protein MotB n=1 Tax=Keratinibaculum paraultunense TaxID=1278232 RepID=A0A4R3KZU9_9FIRM|nr:flagellar motor protein MotB [Keratinibaculum paraultunense]QQY80728.1 flagellar motor protein MotB [Keratinibaculum paraultunense]TCS89664.1 chemotaxis protein MotB [Keratinibaculum paraultunense]